MVRPPATAHNVDPERADGCQERLWLGDPGKKNRSLPLQWFVDRRPVEPLETGDTVTAFQPEGIAGDRLHFGLDARQLSSRHLVASGEDDDMRTAERVRRLS